MSKLVVFSLLLTIFLSPVLAIKETAETPYNGSLNFDALLNISEQIALS